jgi:ABC-2 type transport system permease protein
MRLLRVELSRLTARRAVVLLVLLAALLTALVATTTILDSRPVTPEELATARAEAAAQRDSPDLEDQLSACREGPEDYFGPGATAADCDPLVPTAESFLPRRPLALDDVRRQAGTAVVVLLGAAMIIVGTTYAGADWATGSMSNQLLFEPRRLRVWLAKAVAVTLGCAAVTAALLGGFWLAIFLVAGARDVAAPDEVRAAIGWLAARGVVLGALTGLGGYALTMLLRSTVGTLASLFGYTAGGEALLALAPLDRPGRWSLATNVSAWISDGARVFDDNVVCRPGQAVCDQEYVVSLDHAAAYLGVLLALALVASALSFHRRDVP